VRSTVNIRTLMIIDSLSSEEFGSDPRIEVLFWVRLLLDLREVRGEYGEGHRIVCRRFHIIITHLRMNKSTDSPAWA
jgi:hypothetical protein